MPAASLSLSLRCAACRRVRHDLCAGREAGCRCWQCPGRYEQIVEDAWRRVGTGNSTALLRASLAEVLALLHQKAIRADLVGRSEPVAVTCMVCSRAIAASRFGRRRTTCSGACRTRLWRQRQAARQREADDAEKDLWPPPGFDVGRRRWQSREAFERWWAAHGG